MSDKRRTEMVSLRLSGRDAELLRQAARARGETLSEFIRNATTTWVLNEDPYYWPTTESWNRMTPERRQSEAQRLLSIAESREAAHCKEPGRERSEAVKRARWMLSEALQTFEPAS